MLGSTNSQILLQLNIHKCSWEEAIKRAMIGQEDLLSPELPSSPVGNEFPGGRLPLGLSSLTSHLNPRGSTRHKNSSHHHSSVYLVLKFPPAFPLFESSFPLLCQVTQASQCYIMILVASTPVSMPSMDGTIA